MNISSFPTYVNLVHNAPVDPSLPMPPPSPPRPMFFGQLFLFWDLGFKTWTNRCTDAQTDTMLAYIYIIVMGYNKLLLAHFKFKVF
jgi:hypothetical protein